MKTIISGSRTFNNYGVIKEYLDRFDDITEIVSGTCRGPDTLGERYAKEKNLPIKRFPPDWDKYGRPAGPIRNLQMVKYGDRLVAFWDGVSRGTKNIISLAKKEEIQVFVVEKR